jgi:hypothetical protein
MGVNLIWTFEGEEISLADMGNFFSSAPSPLTLSLVLSHNGNAAITNTKLFIDIILTKDYQGNNTPLKDIADALTYFQVDIGSGFTSFSESGIGGAKTIGTINSGGTKNVNLKINVITTGNLGYHNFVLKTKYDWTV